MAGHRVRRRSFVARRGLDPRADAGARAAGPGPRARRGAGRHPRRRAGPPRPEARQRAPPHRPASDRLRDRAGGRRVAAHGHRPDHRHPDFMAPEQIEGMRESGPQGDVFALGSTLAWAATGRGPFATDQTAATLYRIMAMPPDLRGVPPASPRSSRPAWSRTPCSARLPYSSRCGSAGRTRYRGAPRRPCARYRTGSSRTRRSGAFPPPFPAGGRRLAGRRGGGRCGGGGRPRHGADTSPGPAADGVPHGGRRPHSPQARYVDRLCASGTLLTTLGSTAISPTPGNDPARLKRDYLAVADRTIGTVEAALPDFTVLRDEAPTTRSSPGSRWSSRSSPRRATRSPRGARR